MTILRHLDFYFIQKPKIGEFFLFVFYFFFLLGPFPWIATIHRLAFVRYTALQAESTFLVMKYQAENSLLLRFVPCFQFNSKSAQATRYQGQIFFFFPHCMRLCMFVSEIAFSLPCSLWFWLVWDFSSILISLVLNIKKGVGMSTKTIVLTTDST